MTMPAKISIGIESRTVYYALIASCVLHLVFLAVSYFINPSILRIQPRAMEIRYRSKRIAAAEKSGASVASVSELKEARQASVESKSFMDRQLSKPDFLKSMAALDRSFGVADKQLAKISESAEKRVISVPVLTAQKITNPKYIGYNDRLRDKIRNRAYFYIDDPKFQAGEVYLTFVLSADGTLKDLKVSEERSRANEYLREVGLRSVRESGPFPPFPDELKYPELSFNVIISFEVSNHN